MKLVPECINLALPAITQLAIDEKLKAWASRPENEFCEIINIHVIRNTEGCLHNLFIFYFDRTPKKSEG